MIKKLIKNLNYGFKETIITFFVILILFIVAIQQSRFKSSNEYKGKQLHQGGIYIGKILSTPSKYFDKIQKDEFSKLNEFINKKELTRNGPPFIIYTSKNNESTQYIIAIPIDDCNNINLPLKFVCNYFPKQDVLSVIHKGYLHDRGKAWEILDKELHKKSKKIFNAPFEVFWKGFEQNKDSTTWITGLYYPIK